MSHPFRYSSRLLSGLSWIMCLTILLFFSGQIKAQEGKNITINSSPNYKAIAHLPYVYQVEASASGFAEGEEPTINYRLIDHPEGMTVNTSTGKIEWIPSSLTAGAFVSVEAFDEASGISDIQNFEINITEKVNCPENLQNLFKLDHLTTHFSTDAQMNNNISQFLGNPITGQGILDSAFVLDGDDGLWIDNPDDFSWPGDASFTISVWINDTSASSLNEVVIGRDSRGDGNTFTHLWLGVNTTGHATFFLLDNTQAPLENPDASWNGGLSGGPNLLDGQWHHLVAVRDGQANWSALYVDGVLIQSEFYDYPGDFTDEPDQGPLTIGFLDADKTYNYNGRVDELAVIKQALTEVEITNYFNSVKNSGIGYCASDNAQPQFISTPDTSANDNELFEYNISVDDADAEDTLYLTGTFPSWMQLDRISNKEAVLSGTSSKPQMVSIKLVVSDGIEQDIQEFTFAYGEVSNQPPKITSTAPNQVYEDMEYIYNIKISDSDENDSLSITVDELPAWLTFNSENLTISGIPTNEHVGENTFEITVTDRFGESDAENITITVINTNDPPEIMSSAPTEAYEDALYSYSIDAQDPDANDSLMIIAENLPEWLNIDSVNLKIYGTPLQKDAGEYSFTIFLKDRQKALDVENITLQVLQVNDAPVITTATDTAVISAGSELEISLQMLKVNDEDNTYPDDFSLNILEGDNYTISGNKVIPADSYVGWLMVNVQVNDSTVNSNTYQVPVEVTGTVYSEVQQLPVVLVYPNPSQDYIRFSLQNIQNKIAFVEIFNINGELVMQEKINLKSQQININTLPEGIFIYKIKTHKKMLQTGEFIIRRH